MEIAYVQTQKYKNGVSSAKYVVFLLILAFKISSIMRKLICMATVASLLLPMLQGCGNKKEKCTPEPFPQVQLPIYINDNSQAVNFMVKNFWNRFFKMTPCQDIMESTIYGVDSVSFDQACGQYARLLTMAGKKNAGVSVKLLFANLDSLATAGTRKPMLAVMDRAENYLYNPVSPLLDEEAYLMVLNEILALGSLSDEEKLQYEYQHRICSMNRVGTQAADFGFRELTASTIAQQNPFTKDQMYGNTPPKGYADKTLYKDVKGEYTLLFFNNPDCNSCAGIMSAIKESHLGTMAEDGKLKILAMYIDEDLGAWYNNREKFPDEWIYAFDHNLILRDNNIYGLRAIPSLYLLDKDKKVLLKDATVERVIEYFQ